MYNIQIRYGSEVLNKVFGTQPRLRDITSDNNIKAVLGFGDNVRGLVSGVEIGADTYISNGALVVLETKANQKAE